MLGPLLHRTGEAFVPLVGGDPIGRRPVDFHVAALRALGAEIEAGPAGITAQASRLHGSVRRDGDVRAGPADLVPDGFQHRGRDVDVADLGRVPDRAGPVAQHRRDHVLGHRVLRPAHADVAP